MPNYKVFQDNPDQMRIKIFGSNNVAFNTDASGNLSITASGLAVTGSVDVGTVSITSTGLAVTGNVDVGTVTITSAGLAVTGNVDVGTVTITSTGLAVTGNVDVGTVTITSTGLAVTGNVDVGTVTITSTGLAVTGNVDVGTVTITSTGLAVTGNVDVGTVTITSAGLAVTGSVDVGTVTVTTGSGQLSVAIDSLATTDIVEIIANNNSTSYSGATARTVLGYNAWTFAVKNESLDANAQAVVQIQMSATGASESDWLQEVAPVTINQNSVAFLTSSLLVKYARVYYAAVNSASAVTLNIVFQAQK